MEIRCAGRFYLQPDWRFHTLTPNPVAVLTDGQSEGGALPTRARILNLIPVPLPKGVFAGLWFGTDMHPGFDNRPVFLRMPRRFANPRLPMFPVGSVAVFFRANRSASSPDAVAYGWSAQQLLRIAFG